MGKLKDGFVNALWRYKKGCHTDMARCCYYFIYNYDLIFWLMSLRDIQAFTDDLNTDFRQ